MIIASFQDAYDLTYMVVRRTIKDVLKVPEREIDLSKKFNEIAPRPVYLGLCDVIEEDLSEVSGRKVKMTGKFRREHEKRPALAFIYDLAKIVDDGEVSAVADMARASAAEAKRSAAED